MFWSKAFAIVNVAKAFTFYKTEGSGMKINELIRKYRKEQKLTQEQVANYLGVSAPAVNKWENGISYPDITLLAPLARILKTDVDTLLSFREELTEVEIGNIINEISEEIFSRGFPSTFEKASGIIKNYPHCDKLVLYLAQILNGYVSMENKDLNIREKYHKQILAWFESVAFSEDKELANTAIMFLSENYIHHGEFEEAQRLLDQIPPLGFDKRTIQANLYKAKKEYAKAYEIHESMIYKNANAIAGSLMQIISLLCRENQYEEALKYIELSEKLSVLLDLGSYIPASSKFEVYAEMKKVDESLDALEELLKGIDTMSDIKNSKLYRHMTFKEDSGSDKMKIMMKRALEKDEDSAFLRGNPRFKRLCE